MNKILIRDVGCLNSCNTCVNGFYYWVVWQDWDDPNLVLAFHLGNEVFQVIQWPPIPESRGTYCLMIISPCDGKKYDNGVE